MKVTELDYESPWRPNYESYAVSFWILSAAVASIINLFSDLPPEPVYWVVLIAISMACLRLPAAYRLHSLQKNIMGRALTFMTLRELSLQNEKRPGQVWLGKGFIWQQKHAQRIHEILKRSLSDTINVSPDQLTKDDELGQRWIHGVEPNEDDIFQAVSHANGMTLITGTTGSGKTRTFDLLVSQAIARNEPVFIIDPKGDHELRENARRACEALGCPERFAFFHPSFPEQSIRIDPLANFNRVTELASRIAVLISSETTADPFKSFSWMAADNVNQALVISGQNPSLITLKRFLQNGTSGIVWQALHAHFVKNVPETDDHPSGLQLATDALATAKGTTPEKKAQALCKLYDEWIDHYSTPELDGIVAMYKHDATHFGKMVANLLPIMNMLTAGPLGPMLSPNYEDIDDKRPIINSKLAVDRSMVIYVGLDSLSDSTVGSAIGSILLSDLVAYAGERYNSFDAEKHVNIFIDEAAEVVNLPVIQLLNKGRGAKMRLYVATQTISDFEVRLGGEAQALQILGNMNNLISLRVIDQKTQEYVVANLPKTRIKTVSRSQAQNTNGDSPLNYSASTGEKMLEEEADLFPPQLLGSLPNLEYIAKISGGTIIKGRLPILQG